MQVLEIQFRYQTHWQTPLLTGPSLLPSSLQVSNIINCLQLFLCLAFQIYQTSFSENHYLKADDLEEAWGSPGRWLGRSSLHSNVKRLEGRSLSRFPGGDSQGVLKYLSHLQKTPQMYQFDVCEGFACVCIYATFACLPGEARRGGDQISWS